MAKQTVGIEIDIQDARRKAIERAAEMIVEKIDGEDYSKLDGVIQKAIDAALDKYLNEIVLPHVEKQITEVTLQETNRWGEKTGGKKVPFKEYLVERAEKWLAEEVNYDGKSKASDSFGWKPYQTRVAHMVHNHLHFHIERAMNEALKTANSAIVGGIEHTVKMKLAEVSAAMSIQLKTK